MAKNNFNKLPHFKHRILNSTFGASPSSVSPPRNALHTESLTQFSLVQFVLRGLYLRPPQDSGESGNSPRTEQRHSFEISGRTDHWFGQGQGEHGAHDARVSRALACVCSFGCRPCNPRPLLRHAPQLCFIRRFSIIPNDWIEPPGTRRVLRESTSSHRLHRTWIPA